MNKKMYHAAPMKGEREPKHMPISRATSYVPGTSALYEPATRLNPKDSHGTTPWDRLNNQNSASQGGVMGSGGAGGAAGGYGVGRQYVSPAHAAIGYQQTQQNYISDMQRTPEMIPRQSMSSKENNQHGYQRASNDFQAQQNFANPYILRQMKSNHEASSHDLDASGRGLVSNFARKMHNQSSDSQSGPFPPSSVATVGKQLGNQAKQSSYLQTNDLQQLRVQRAAFKEYEQKYYAASNFNPPSSSGRGASLKPMPTMPLQSEQPSVHQQVPVAEPPSQIHSMSRAAAPATSKSPTRPSFVPPLPIGNGAVSMEQERRPAVNFHPEDDDMIESSISSIRDEERKEEESVDEDVHANRLEDAQVEDDQAYQSPERPRRTIQEQQTCWRQRNGSVEERSQEPRGNDGEGSPAGVNRANAMQRVQANRIAHNHQASPDPVQIQTFFFQSPDKRGKYIDQNPESPPKIQLQDQRRIRNSNAKEKNHNQQLSVNLQNQIDRQIQENGEMISPYDVHKAALTLQQQNNTEPAQGIRKSQSLVRGSSKHATRSTTINEADQLCQANTNGQIIMENQTIIVPEVYMRCVTWTRDSNGLFDYESKNISKKNIKTQTGGRVVRIGEEVQLVSKSHKLETLAFHDADANQMIDPQRMVIIERSMGGFGNFLIRNDTCKRLQDVEAQHTNNPDHLPQNMFVVVRNTKSTLNNQDYKLCRGDTVKLGRIKFKVKAIFNGGEGDMESPCKKDQSPKSLDVDSECSSDDEDQAFKTIDIDMSQMSARSKLSRQLNAQAAQQVPDTKRDDEKANRQCKICWMAESTEPNPLLSACQCDGSMRFIHFNCLKHWISEKMVRKEIDLAGMGKIFTYTWKHFECEICKHAYPLTFKSKVNDRPLIYGIVKDLIQPDMPQVEKSSSDDRSNRVPYLLIQSLPFEKTSGRVVHLIIPDKTVPELPPLEQNAENADAPDQRHMKVFKMGRGHESSVRICDISVSRCHTLIKFDPIKCQFQLEDNLSKFGTLVLPKTKDIELEPNCTKAVQIGRSVISFTVKEVEKIIQKKTLSQSPNRLTQHTTSKDLETMVKENSNQFQKMNTEGSMQQNPISSKQIQEQIERAQQMLDKNAEAPQFNDNEQQQLEFLLKQKIHETNQKIEKLMKCESKYIEQLKQQLNDPGKKDDESLEDALIKAANSLIQAKYQLDEIDNKSKLQQQSQGIPQVEISEPVSRQQSHAQRSQTTEKKIHTSQAQQNNSQYMTDQKVRAINQSFTGQKKEQLQKSTHEQIDDIIQKFSPERGSRAALNKQQQARMSVPSADGIAPYNKVDIRKHQNTSTSKTSLKKDLKTIGDQSSKRVNRDHAPIIEDYRIPCQIPRKNTAKSPSPKRAKVGRNTSPFIVSSQKPIKTSKQPKTASKHYHGTQIFSEQKVAPNGRYNQSPMNKADLRSFDPMDDQSPVRAGHGPSMMPVTTTDPRASNPFRLDSYDLGGNNLQYSQHKMNNYMSGAGSQGSYLAEFNDAQYRKSLTNSKMAGGRGGTTLGSSIYQDLYEPGGGASSSQIKHTQSTSYQPPHQSSFATSHHHQSFQGPSGGGYSNGGGQSRFYNNYIGNGLLGAPSASSVPESTATGLAGQHRISNQLAAGSRYGQQYGPSSANLGNAYKISQAGYGATATTQGRYGASTGYKRPYY